MLYYQREYRRNGEKTTVNKNITAQSAELWECALNYNILRRLKENSEEEAWARLFSCSLFSGRVRADEQAIEQAKEQAKEKRVVAYT